MLTENTIASVYPLATLVTRQGKCLQVRDGSALADMMSACDPLDGGFEVEGEEASFDRPEQVVLESSASGEDGHDEATTRIRDAASKAVAFTMDVARNKVVPQTKGVVEATEAFIDLHRKKRVEPLVIEPEYLSPVYQSSVLSDLTASYRDAQVMNVPALVLNAPWSDEAGVAMLYTGVSDFDADLANHFTGEMDLVKDTWQRFFGGVPGLFREADFQTATPTIDTALVAFLGANGLLENPQVPETLAVDLRDYRTYLAKVREQAGARIAYFLKGMENARRAKQLVLSAPKVRRPGEVAQGTIRVVGEVYNDWLNEGGSPEALFGAVSQGAAFNYTTLLQGAEGYAAAWGRILNILDSQIKFEQQSVTLQGLQVGLVQLASQIEDSQLPMPRSDVEGAISQRLAKVKVGDLTNLYPVARCLVCDLFYAHTDAERFLDAMDAVCQSKPNLPVREAALLVAIDYVTEWVADQIAVVDVANVIRSAA